MATPPNDGLFSHDDYLTLTQAAREGKTSIPALYRWSRKGLKRASGVRLPMHWVGSRTMIRRSELRAFLELVRNSNPNRDDAKTLAPSRSQRRSAVKRAADRLRAAGI